LKLFVAVAALVVAGCGGHAARTLEIREALDAGQPKRALALLNEELEVDSEKQLPDEAGGDNALLLLDRAMVLMQLDQYELSSRDLMTADKQIEVLDLSRNATDELGRYLFSDDVGPYKAPAYEKLLINTMNMVSFLARGDLNGARIEARRLAVMQRFIKEHEDPARSLLGPGSYLAGFTFEKSGRPQEALRYYDEALEYGRYSTLVEPIRELAKKASYRSPRIREILGEQDPAQAPPPPPPPGPGTEPAEEAPPPTAPQMPALPPPPANDGEILVIVGFGRVPAKVAKRVPIGLALTYASGALSPHDRQKASYLAAQGLVTWVNYPELGRGRGQYDIPEFALDGRWQRIEGVLAVDREAKRAWDEAKGAVIASAITRMIARVVAGEAVRRGSGGGTLGALLSLGTQATLTATDTPDTRSWATLPARLAFGRVRVKPGTHWVVLGARGLRKRQQVRVSAGGFAVVNMTVLH
jgi:tetratricopeptide (TPR) repeat protein